MTCPNLKPRPAIIRSCALAASLAIFGAGCQTTTNYEHVTGAVLPPPEAYMLTAGDEIDIKFYYSPELNELAQTIRPDGKISLQLVGDVQAAGLTPGDLAKTLKDKYHGLIDKNEVAVIAHKSSHRVVYVGGAVQRPQAVPMTGPMTALAAILSAGGEDERSAAMGQVVVLRLEDGKYRGYALDLERTLAGQDLAPFYLAPGDTVYVSRTHIYDMDKWMDQHVTQLWPKVGVTVLHQAGNNLMGVDMSR